MIALPISEVLVAGGGIVGWSAAAALRRRLPQVAVTVVATAPAANALADRIGCTLPSIVEFHSDIGLGEKDTVLHARSGLRLGTRFEGWSADQPAYVHAYGDYGRPLGASPFYQHWLRAREMGEVEPFDSFCGAAAIGAGGKFFRPQSSASQVPDFAYGLHIDPPTYLEMMRAYALHLGAREFQSQIADIRLRSADGFIEALVLNCGTEVSAELFVDATGPAAQVRGQLNRDREDWSNYLPCDRMVIMDSLAETDAPAIDRAIAFEAGWQWEAASPSRHSAGIVYSSGHLADEKAEALLGGGDRLEIHPGRYTEPWLRNCLAIGDCAVSIEPLEWTNLHLAHNAIDRLVAMMPDTDCNPVELWDYNRQANAEADRVRDFVMLHYAASNRPTDAFWNEASMRPLPASLEHTLVQFRERGRLPFYEEETFARDSWAAILIGQGVYPRRTDPLLDEISPGDSLLAMRQLHDAIGAVAARAPSHSSYLRNLAMQESR
jgi:tryptophan 7-halogenase